MKRLHLLPLLSFVPFIVVLLLITQLNVYMDPIIIAVVSIAYIATNVVYRALKNTLEIGYVVEYSLIALVAYFVLTLYV